MKGIIGGVSNKKQIADKKMGDIKNLLKSVSKRRTQVQPIDFEKDLDIDEVIPKEHQLMEQIYASESSCASG